MRYYQFILKRVDTLKKGVFIKPFEQHFLDIYKHTMCQLMGSSVDKVFFKQCLWRCRPF